MTFNDSVATMLNSMNHDVLSIHEERCISIRNRNADCLRCVKSCTSGALSFIDGSIKVTPEKCIGCGTCATACPTCAIELSHPSDQEIAEALKNAIVTTQGNPVLACATFVEDHQIEPQPAMVVMPCLGRVDESLLVLAAAYRSKSITLACGQCQSCEHSCGGALLREVEDSAKNMLVAMGNECEIVHCDKELPDILKAVSDLHERDNAGSCSFDLGLSVKNSPVSNVVSIEAHLQKVGDDGTLSHHIPSRRDRLFNCLRHIGEPVKEDIDSRIVGAVTINTDACCACRMCAVFCPTGAIKKIDRESQWGLTHLSSACMQCRTCENICPKEALTVSSVVPVRQFLGKERISIPLEKPEWVANKPDSMYNKVHSALGEDLEMCMF